MLARRVEWRIRQGDQGPRLCRGMFTLVGLWMIFSGEEILAGLLGVFFFGG